MDLFDLAAEERIRLPIFLNATFLLVTTPKILFLEYFFQTLLFSGNAIIIFELKGCTPSIAKIFKVFKNTFLAVTTECFVFLDRNLIFDPLKEYS